MITTMKKSTFTFALLLLGISLFGCANAALSESNFKVNFSLNSIVEANRQYLLEEDRISSGAASGSGEPFAQSHEKTTLRIDPANVPAFMEAVRSDIEQSLLDSGARTLGSESDGNEHFSFIYIENDLHGTIHVWGVPGEESSYTLILLITEN
jgi:hypothetical protein